MCVIGMLGTKQRQQQLVKNDNKTDKKRRI